MEQALSALGGAVQGVHPFVIYLAGINALTFILFAIDYAIARYNQDEDTGLMDGRILTLFAVAGGALGMLLALMIFTRNHMNKHNIAWWFSAIVFLIVCACRARLGRSHRRRSGTGRFVQRARHRRSRCIPSRHQRHHVRRFLPGQEEGD